MATRTYDLIMLLDADAPSETRDHIMSEAETLIQKVGEIKTQKSWGTRPIPFRINHHVEAHYHIYQFEAPPDGLDKLDHSLRIMEGVLRFRIAKATPGDLPDPPPIPKRGDGDRGYERPPENARADDYREQPTNSSSEADVVVAEPAAE